MSLALIGVVVVTRLRMTAIALGLLGSSFAIGQASAAMPVNGLAAAEKQISTNVEDVRWAPGHHWHGRHWGWHHPGWLGMAHRMGVAPLASFGTASVAPVAVAPLASMAPVGSLVIALLSG